MTNLTDIARALVRDLDHLRRVREDLDTLLDGGRVENLSADGARATIRGLELCIEAKRSLLENS